MPCECSSIQFGTVAEVLDRDCLEVIDPIAGCQDVEEAPEDEVLTEGVMNNPRKLKELEGLIEVDDVQAEFEEVLDLETANSCHELQNGSSIRKTNESVGGTAEEVLTERDVKEALNSVEECSVKVSTLRDKKEPIDVVEASIEAVSHNNPQNGMESKAAEGQGEITFVEKNCTETSTDCKENEDEFHIQPREIRNMKRKQAMKIKKVEIQPLNVSYENFNLFSVLPEDELCKDIEQMSAGVDILSHQNMQVDYSELNASEKTVIKGNPKQPKMKCKRSKIQNVKQSGTKRNQSWARCQNCFKTHFPYPKLCRWERSMQKMKFEHLDEVNECITIPNELKLKIRKQVARIEAKGKPWEDLICEAVLQKDSNSSNLPDLVLENQSMKLKGGAGQSKDSFKVKQFVSKIEEFNSVLNLLRSSNMFEQFNSHNKCPVKDLCSFCLLRSSIYRVNSSKGRKKIVPAEVECEHGRNPKPISNSETLVNVINKVIISMPGFKKAISPTWCSKPLLQEEGILILLNEEGENRKRNWTAFEVI